MSHYAWYLIGGIVLVDVGGFGLKSILNLPDDIGTHDLADDLHKKVER